MPRVANSTTRRRRHRALLTRTVGFRLKRKNVFKRAKEATLKAGPYAYVHRRLKKREYRRQWNVQINAAARMNDTTYSQLIAALKAKNIQLDRKVLAAIATQDAAAFTAIVKVAA